MLIHFEWINKKFNMKKEIEKVKNKIKQNKLNEINKKLD